MEYRIKHIIKYNGEKQFIPQFRNDDWDFKVIAGVILFPILLLFEVIFHGKLKVLDYFFIHWKDIEYSKTIFSGINHYFLDYSVKAHAEEIIKRHKQHLESEKEKALQDEIKKRGDQTRKTIYIKVK